MKKIISGITLALITFSATEAYAANWYWLNKATSDKIVYFFDMETVVKQGDTVTIWEKYVTEENSPGSDGSYASASKSIYICKDRKYQSLTSSIYDKEGKFIRTYPNPGKLNDLVPGSIGDAILKTVCAKDFPNSKSTDFYMKVDGNDVIKTAANYFFYLKTQKDTAPN